MDSDRVFEARLAEHVSAREELLAAINNQHLALTFGTAALIAMFGAGFVAGSNKVTPAIFFAALPLSWWILAMWLGEVVRMLRAVEFCAQQEKLINSELELDEPRKYPPLRWESWRQEADKPWRTITWTYMSVGLFLALADLAALACGTIWALEKSHWSAWVVALVGGLLAAIGIAVAWRVYKTFSRWGAVEIGIPNTGIAGRLLSKASERSQRTET